MTFTEAAAEVLRLIGKPLHYKDITELAIQKNLLSHVGKSPEVTMGSRLAALLKKGPKENPLVRIKPGVFALRAWEDGGPPGPAPDAVPAPPAATPAPAPVKGAGREPGKRGHAPAEKKERPAPAPAEAAEPIEAAAAPEPTEAAPEQPEAAELPEAEPTTAADETEATGAEAGDDEGDEAPTAVLPVAAALAPSAATPQPPAATPQPMAVTPQPPAATPSAPHAARTVDPTTSRNVSLGERYAPGADELMRADLAAGATDMFGEEDDDDQPILGGDPAADAAGGRRRRRRRRGRGPEVRGEEAGLPSYTVSPAFGDAPREGAAEARADQPRDRGDQPRERNDQPRDRGDQPRERNDQPRERGDQPRDRGERGDQPRDRGERGDQPRDRGEQPRDRGERSDQLREGRDRRDDRGERGEGRHDDAQGDRRDDRGQGRVEPMGEGDDVFGRDMVDIVLAVLSSFDRNGGAVSLRTLAEAAQRRGRLQGDIQALQSQMMAAARADNLRRVATGQRPRFRIQGGRVALTDWGLHQDLLRLEGEALAAVERYRDGCRKALARKLTELPPHAFVEVAVTLLERIGMTQIKAIKRPGAGPGEAHLSALLKGPGAESRVAVVIRKDGREIGRERVIEVRGSHHHYGSAAAAWLLTAGQVLSGAREEASVIGALPVTLLDGAALARCCEEQGVAVMRTQLTIAIPDLEFFEAVRGS
jgi:hypothetical protein